MIKDLTTEEFKTDVFDFVNNKDWVYEKDLPCVVKFGADWCAPCRQLEPILEDLSNIYENKVNFYKVDVDENHELAGAFNIRSIPVMLYIPMDGNPQMTVGTLPKSQIVAAINDIFKLE
jgi:thioredoxin